MDQPTNMPAQNSSFSGQAIILAGGLGTRLRPVVNDVPKCMAPVAGKPFLHYVIQHLQQQGIEEYIFSIGYMGEAIEQLLATQYPQLRYQLSIEESPLGTGGAIQQALKKASHENVVALNGDTLFTVDLGAVMDCHLNQQAECTLSLKPMQQFDRYGLVEIDGQQCIRSFKEKQYYENGLISGGVYIINKAQFLARQLPEKFSIEKEYLERFVGEKRFFGVPQETYFIDIGIPEDFERAQTELKQLYA
jgi:D-glycero-alpha-D-manno-heptose 1-phosphate guanylyltransferase